MMDINTITKFEFLVALGKLEHMNLSFITSKSAKVKDVCDTYIKEHPEDKDGKEAYEKILKDRGYYNW